MERGLGVWRVVASSVRASSEIHRRDIHQDTHWDTRLRIHIRIHIAIHLEIHIGIHMGIHVEIHRDTLKDTPKDAWCGRAAAPEANAKQVVKHEANANPH